MMDWKAVALLPEKERMRILVEHWKRIGPELEKIKRAELRALTEEEATAKAIRVMGSRPRHARESARRRCSSGLVEQQRILAKAVVSR